jgi:hypothetical protein
VKPIHNVLIIGIFLIVAALVMVLAGIRDESIKMNRFDCRMLIGGWHPDVPRKVVEQCRKGVPNDYSSKTNY